MHDHLAYGPSTLRLFLCDSGVPFEAVWQPQVALSGSTRVWFGGELCTASSAELRPVLLSWLDRLGPSLQIVVNLGDVVFVDGRGMKLLIEFQWRASELGHTVRFEHPCDLLLRMARIVGYDAVFTASAVDGREGLPTPQLSPARSDA